MISYIQGHKLHTYLSPFDQMWLSQRWPLRKLMLMGFYTWIFAQSSLLLVLHPDAYPKWVYGRFHILVVGFLRWCNLMDSMVLLKQAHLKSLSIIKYLMSKVLLQTEWAFNNLMVIFAAALVGGNSAEEVSHDLDLGCHISYLNKDFLTVRLSL